MRSLVALVTLLSLAMLAGPGAAQPPAPPLTATIFFPAGTPTDGEFVVGQPIPITLQIENTSGGTVATTDGFSATEFFRRLFFTDPQGGTVTNKIEEQIHDVSRVFMCLTRDNALLPVAIPVVPIELLPATGPQRFFREFAIPDARAFYDLSRPGTYTVNARIPLMVFTLTDPTTVFNDCDQVPGQVANVGAVSGLASFTVLSNTLSFSVTGAPPGPPVTTASVSPVPSPNPTSWLRQAAVVTFNAASPSQVPLQRIVVQTSGAEAGVTNLTGSQGSVTVSADGLTSVGFHAEDAGGNIEDPQVLQVRVDGTAPVITVTVPAQGGSYGQGQSVSAAYSCADPASGVATCAGTVANSVAIDTSTPGLKSFVVNASDVAGNVSQITVAYTVTTSATGPDLVVTALSGVPATVLPGGRFSVTDTVLNQGNATAGASTNRYYLSENTQKSAGDTMFTVTRAVVSRAPGQISTGTRAITVPTTMPTGTYYVLVCADDLEKVVETNEANNCRASSAVVVVGRPDLVATAVSDPPPVVTPGGTFSVTDTVANQGTAMSGASTTRYYVSLTTSKTADSKLLTGTRAVAAMAAGAPPSQGTKTVTVPTTTALGTYYLLACADDLARVIELNESPNCVASSTQVTVARPDLTVSVLSNPPASAAKGSKFAITETVSNVGLVGAGASTTRYYMSLNASRDATDKLLMGGSRAVPAIGAGSANPAPAPVMVTVPTTLASGTYFVIACADDLKRVTEANETNNCRVSTTTVVVP